MTQPTPGRTTRAERPLELLVIGIARDIEAKTALTMFALTRGVLDAPT